MIKTNTSTSGSPKLHRKTIQRNRRIHIKSLCFKYLSSIPYNDLKPTKDMLYQQDQLDLAATYIKHLKERIQKLKGEKEIFNIGSQLPLIEIKDLGLGIGVKLISGLNKNLMLYEVISVLEEDGAEVVTVNFSTVADKFFTRVMLRIGVEPTRVYQRLPELIAPLESWEYIS
uniref:BHLH domain-containing protein n=1 Tax=Glycine max TaxID=3847 RepID=A0A0R0KGX9_SOYBN